MNSKFGSKITLITICVIFSSQYNQLFAMPIPELRENFNKTMEETQQQIKISPVETRDIQRRILSDTRDELVQRTIQPASPFRPITNRINIMLSKEQVSPEEINTLRMELEKVAAEQDIGFESSEYKNLKDKLDISYTYTKAITELRESQTLKLEELEKIYNNTADSGDKAALWRNIFSGGFALSFLANMVNICGLMIKAPNAKLEKQLKELQIVEMKAQLEQNGIDPGKYL